MKKSTSYRLNEFVRTVITQNGGASFIQGCVLLTCLLDAVRTAREISLSYDMCDTSDFSKWCLRDAFTGEVIEILLPNVKLSLKSGLKEALPLEYDPEHNDTLSAEMREACHKFNEMFGDIQNPL